MPCFSLQVVNGNNNSSNLQGSKEDAKIRERGAVLVFLPGLMEIDNFFKLLNEPAVVDPK